MVSIRIVSVLFSVILIYKPQKMFIKICKKKGVFYSYLFVLSREMMFSLRIFLIISLAESP